MRRFWVVVVLVGLAVPVFATEPNPSARQRELVEKLLTVIKLNDMMRSTIDAMYAQLEKQFEPKDATGDSAVEAKEMFASFRAKLAKVDFGGEMHEAYVRVYSKYFTEAELADLIAFYQTHTGQKALDLQPQLMTEGMQIASEHLMPKIQAVMNEVEQESEQKRPWRKTMTDMRWVATAIEAYSLDHDDQYPAGDYASLKALLVPTYLKEFPEKDMWGREYAYVVSDDHKHYRIISAGADSNFEWDSRRIVLAKDNTEPETNYKERLEDDLIYADGNFIQAPVQAKPKQ